MDGIQALECVRRDSCSMIVVGRKNAGVGNRNNNPVVDPMDEIPFLPSTTELPVRAYGVPRIYAGRCFPCRTVPPQRREYTGANIPLKDRLDSQEPPSGSTVDGAGACTPPVISRLMLRLATNRRAGGGRLLL